MSASISHPSRAQRWTIGRNTDCDLIVSAAAVSGHHCCLTFEGNVFYLEDLASTNGVYVNGKRIHGKIPVSRGDRVTLGQNVPMPWPSLAQAQAPVPLATIDGADSFSQDDERTAVREKAVIIGRDPKCDLVINVPTVSWQHARLTVRGPRGLLEDLNSANGTYLGSRHNRVTDIEIAPGDVVFFGTYPVPAVRLFFPPPNEELQRHADLMIPDDSAETLRVPARQVAKETITVGDKPIVMGRDPLCQHVIQHPMISWRHARVEKRDGQIYVEDLGSTNGTFVNGRAVDRATPVKAGDVLTLGNYSITLKEAGVRTTLVAADLRGTQAIEARGVSVSIGNKQLIDNISISIRPAEFMGLMGPSGCGKSTLINVLTGYMNPTEGAVLIDGRNLQHQVDLLRGQIGFVPQDDIMHRDLTVYEALFYAARLRLPSDYSDAEIDARIEVVLEQLGLQGTQNVLIGSPEKKGISGGQRKRVNLAMELLTDPTLLILDEPTSGLSSEDAVIVMTRLRDLANEGKTILLTIHQPSLELFRKMDLLAVIDKDSGSDEPGRLAYFGPAYPDAVDYFEFREPGKDDPIPNPHPDSIMRQLNERPARFWADRYSRSDYRKMFVSDRQTRLETFRAGDRPIRRRELGFRQTWTMLGRNLRLKLRDRAHTALLLLQAPIIAVLIAVVFGRSAQAEITVESWPDVTQKIAATLFLLALSSLWCGCSNAVREFVGERAIYKRERMVNLKIPAYIGAKFGVLMLFSLIQTLILLSIVYFANGLQGSFALMFGLLMLCSMLGTSIGLLISSIARTTEFAVAMLPVVILPMIMLGGMLQPLPSMGKVGQWATQVSPSRWAFEGMLLAEAPQRPTWTPPPDLAAAELGVESDLAAGGDSQPAAKAEAVDETSAEAEQSNDPAPEPVEQDIAEPFFPVDDQRTSIAVCALVLASMWMLALALTSVSLKRRDRR